MIGVRVPAGTGNFSRHHVQTGSRAQSASYPMGSWGVKRSGREADHSPPSSAEVKECVELYLDSPSMSSWRGAYLSTETTLPLGLPPLYGMIIVVTQQIFPVQLHLSFSEADRYNDSGVH
jgi:hypothetical protein